MTLDTLNIYVCIAATQLLDSGRYTVMEGADEEAVVDGMWPDEGGMVQDLQQLNLQDPLPGQEAVVDGMWPYEGGMVQDLQHLNLQHPLPGQEEPANQVPEAPEPAPTPEEERPDPAESRHWSNPPTAIALECLACHDIRWYEHGRNDPDFWRDCENAYCKPCRDNGCTVSEYEIDDDMDDYYIPSDCTPPEVVGR